MRAVGVWTGVSHGQQTWSLVLLGEVLVWELATVDGLTTSTVTGSEVTTLQHEIWDHTVERGAGVAEALFTSTQSSEVFSSLWDNVVVQLENDTAQWLTIRFNIKKYLRHVN